MQRFRGFFMLEKTLYSLEIGRNPGSPWTSKKDPVGEGFMKPLQSTNFVFTGQRYDSIRAQKSISNSQHIGERK